MTRAQLQLLIREWCLTQNETNIDFGSLKREVDFLGDMHYCDYEVTSQGHHPPFPTRLARWIANLDDDADRQILFSILKHVFFIGSNDQDAAYRTAYSRHVLQWLCQLHDMDSFSDEFEENLKKHLERTRYTEITDSFGVRRFCTLNQIQGETLRYRWGENPTNWSVVEFRREILGLDQNNNLIKENLVLFEDFVGSGSQALDAIQHACSLGEDVSVLFCPLFICPEGAALARELARTHANFTFSPVLEIGPSSFITPEAAANEPDDFASIRGLLIRIHGLLNDQSAQHHGPFGYRNTGGLVVPASNCPDNTVPVLHRYHEDSWYPLFLRNSREPL